MGLLDYNPDPIGQGLLGLGTALMRPRAMGGGMAAGLDAFNANALQAKQLQRQAQQDALREQLLQAQMAEYGAQTDERKSRAALIKQKADEEAAARARQDEFWKMFGGGNGAVVAQTGGLAPTNANAALRNQPMPMTTEVALAAARAGIPLDTLKAAATAGDWGRSKVSRETTVAGPDGMPRTLLLDEFGRPVGDALPQAVKREMLNTGNAFTPVNPYTQSGPLPIGMSAAERDSSARGWASNALQRERFAYEKAQQGGGGGFEYRQTPEGLVVVPKVPSAEGPVQARPVLNAAGVPVGGSGAGGTSPQQKVADATEALSLIKDAEKIIDTATGSFFGAGLDIGARAFGSSTAGARGAAQLQALEGALVSKMPKMSGPQSDRDVQLYRQMAGQIGDPTIPAETKRAALNTIRQIQNRYAGVPETATPIPEAPSAAGMPLNLQELARQELQRRGR
jgi:hypothetical protein